MRIFSQNRVWWLTAAGGGLGLAYSLSIRFTPIMTAPRPEKLLLFGTLLPLGLVFSIWFFSLIIRPLTSSFSMKQWLLFGCASALAAMAIFGFFYRFPPFPEQHEFHLTVLEEKEPNANGMQVELISISTVAMPSGSPKRLPVNQLALMGAWRGSNSGYGLIGEAGAEIKFQQYMQAGLALDFAAGPSAGAVRIEWDGQVQTLDLYRSRASELTLTLPPRLDLRRAHATHQAMTGAALMSDFFTAAFLIFALFAAAARIFRGNKITILNPRLLGLMLLGVLLLQAGAAAINRPVVFNNDPLEAAVRDALNRPKGVITSRHLQTMAALDASNRGISRLEGIEWMPNLRELDLRGNHVSDIAVLSGLTRLEKLNLRGNAVRDLEPLARLDALEYLNLYANKAIADLRPLNGLTSLRTLIVASVPLGEQVSGLSGLTELKKLNLRNTGITTIEPIAQLRGLEYLNLSENPGIRSLEPISHLDRMETLILAGVPAGERLGFLGGLTRLRYLNLRECGATDLAGLAGLYNLEYLNLHSNSGIRSILPLAGLKRLETLILANVPAGNETEVLENFSRLKVLNLRNTGLTDLSRIGTLMARGALRDDPKRNVLAALDIRQNPIAPTGGDDYAAVRPYWNEISGRRPVMLPFHASLEAPAFSRMAGFYEDDILLEILSGQPGTQIHFTLDGSQPTLNSALYTGPLEIKNRMTEPNGISTIEDIAAGYRPPLHSVAKASVVRAIAIDPRTGAESPIVTQTYFVGSELERRYSLPVVSLAASPVDLFDSQTGIYVLGGRYASKENVDLTEDQRQVFANFNQHGREWERPVSVEIFEPDGGYFNQDGGVRVHGAGSRRSPQKSLRVYARPEYAVTPTFNYPLFAGPAVGAGESFHAMYPTFILRNGGQDWAISMLRDAFAQRLAAGSALDTQAGRFAVVFLNGEYWGIYHLQERYDAAYLENHYGIPYGQGVILGLNGELISGETGDEAAYDEMVKFIRRNDLAEEDVYARLDTMMDISSYMDYLIFEIYAANQDWPDKNIYMWRMKADGYPSNTPHAVEEQDGRWRWMLIDMDFTFGLKHREGDITHDTLQHAQLPGWSGFIFRELLKNEGFRREFQARFEEHLATTFAPERVQGMLNATVAELYPYMDEFFDRWGTGSLQAWEEEITLIHRFANERPSYLKELLGSVFDE